MVNWTIEKERFERLAYRRALGAAYEAFRRWHPRKRDDAVAEMIGKVWATWRCNVERGKDPVTLLGANIRWAILWVRYDRRIAGRARCYDVFDYRAGMTRHDLDGQGRPRPADRSDRQNHWIGCGAYGSTTTRRGGRRPGMRSGCDPSGRGACPPPSPPATAQILTVA